MLGAQQRRQVLPPAYEGIFAGLSGPLSAVVETADDHELLFLLLRPGLHHQNYQHNLLADWGGLGSVGRLVRLLRLQLGMKWFQFDNPAFKVKVLDYTYTSEPSINTALPVQTSKLKTILFIFGVILTFGFLWLLSKWSARKKALFLTTISSLPTATHFLIEDEDSEGEMTLVQRQDKYEIRLKRTCPSFIYRDRNYIYVEEKEVFVPIRYQQLGHHLDKLKRDKFRPLSQQRRKELLGYYGENVMKLQIQSRLEIFIQEMLTPYEVFQTYGIILWIYEEYYVFSLILMAYSLYTYWMNSSEIRSNQQKLAYESYFDVQTKVLVDDGASIDQDQQEVELCTNGLKVDEHRSQIMKDNFNGIDNEEVEMTVVKRRSREVKNQENNLINNRNVRFQTISSHQLVPGDIIILNELDIVPCDCILLRGEALANQKYSTGENYLIRKEEIENFTYLKENQKSFVLYLGSQIVKTKNIEYRSKRTADNELECIQSSMREDRIDSASEIVCLVTHTNFSTLRGKYLRAIRYQSKNKEQFFRETIYFIYIIIFIASLVYFAYLAVLGPYTREIDMFRTYMDLLITAIPPTLPTILNVGIEFVTRRLKAQGINSVMARSILTGGKIDTIILKGDQVFGKEYDIHSAAIGTKGQRGFGLTFASVNEFQAYHDSEEYSGMDDLERRRQEKSEFYRIGSFFINALATCHTLQFFNRQTHGSVFEKKIFEFSQGRNTKEDEFETLNHSLQVRKIIRFKGKVAKLAVLVAVKDRPEILDNSKDSYKQQQQINENEVTIKHNRRRSFQQQQKGSQQFIFLKGAAEKVLHNCAPHSYPENAFEYVVDMAEKGFILHAYAMRPFTVQAHEQFDFAEYVNHCEFTFLGFVVLQQAKSEENMAAIRELNSAAVKIIFVSEQRELDAASKAMFNGICSKNELLLCGLAKSREKVVCKGHIQWESSSAEMFSEFVTEFQEFGRGSKVSLSADLFEELFMKREMAAARQLFEKAIIFNKMEIKHQKNLFNQLQRDGKICCAVGRSGSLYESANLTLELQREHGALLSSFYTSSTSLKSIVNCLRICRAGLSTNLHGFGMMILFSLIQLTTTVILNMNYQALTTDQSLYEDLFITFPIFVTINLTQPATLLSKELPPNSFFSLRNVLSMVGQLLIQFLAQLGFILYVLSLQFFKQERSESHDYYIQNGGFRSGSALTLALFVLSNNLYLGIVLSTSVSKPFRKPFYTNPFYTLNLILIWCYNTCLVIFPRLSPTEMRSKTLNQESEFVLIVALLVGNLVMVVMYLYENMLVFLWGKENPCLKRGRTEEYQLEEGIK